MKSGALDEDTFGELMRILEKVWLLDVIKLQN